MATAQQYNLGEFEFPRGWFLIAQAHEAEHKPKPIRYFGEDLVLYRGASGQVYVVEAYCPHLGAHLAHNSTSYIVLEDRQVEGEDIRCPYHGWKFNGASGQCNEIPYSPAPIPKQACLRTFPAQEWGGLIFVWYDPEGGEPDYELPPLVEWEDSSWVNWKLDYMGQVDLHPVEVLDNMVDKAHFEPIHGSENIQLFENIFDAHTVRQIFEAGHKTLSDDILKTNTWYTGPGILMSRMAGYYNSLMLIANTQVDAGVTKAWHALMVQVPSNPPSDEDKEAAYQFQEASRIAFNQDFDVWSSKRPCLQPLQVIGDGPFGKLRTWYKQFYNPRDRAAQYQKAANGTYVTKGTATAPFDK